MVKDINKLITKKIFEIIFVIGFVFFASYLWNTKNTQEFLTSIAAFSNLHYTNFMVENPIDYSMFPMDDEYAMKNLKPCTIKVINETYTNEEYVLVLKISKESTMDYHFLNIGVNDAIYSLNNLEKYEDESAYVFTIAKDSIVGNTKNYEVRIWLNEMAGNELQGKNLILNFDLLNKTTQM